MKHKKNQEPNTQAMVGNIAFLVGIILSFVMIFVNASQMVDKIVFTLLVVIGLVVGYVNITNKEAVPFMIAVIALVLLFSPFVSSLAQIFQLQGASLAKMGALFANLSALFVPAGFLVALRTFILTSKDE